MDVENIIVRIVEKTGFDKESVENRILVKQKELSGLISREGAAYIIAKDLGLDIFEDTKRRLQIKNIVPGIRNVNINVRVFRVFEPIYFERDGKKSCVANVILFDESGTVRLSLWDTQIEMLPKLKQGDSVNIFGAYSKDDRKGGVEIRLSKIGGIKHLEKSEIPEMKEPTVDRVMIKDLKEGMRAEIRAAVVQIFEGNPFYEVCPECGSRLKRGPGGFVCKTHGTTNPKFSIVLCGVIDDGTENTRAVFFRDTALQLIGMNMETVLEKMDGFFKEIDVLGKEFIISGTVKNNKLFKRNELVVTSVTKVDVKNEADKLINEFSS